MFSADVNTEIVIEGVSIEDAWNALLDFPSYPNWNSMLVEMEMIPQDTPFEVGAKIDCDCIFANGKKNKLKFTVDKGTLFKNKK